MRFTLRIKTSVFNLLAPGRFILSVILKIYSRSEGFSSSAGLNEYLLVYNIAILVVSSTTTKDLLYLIKISHVPFYFSIQNVCAQQMSFVGFALMEYGQFTHQKLCLRSNLVIIDRTQNMDVISLNGFNLEGSIILVRLIILSFYFLFHKYLNSVKIRLTLINH